MCDEKTLLPPVHVIYERLSLNARERHRLNALLRLARHAEKDQDDRPVGTSFPSSGGPGASPAPGSTVPPDDPFEGGVDRP
jgi:hypothetical protein